MARTETEGLERTLVDIRLFQMCRRLPSQALTELGWLCRHFTHSQERPIVPETVLKHVSLEERFMLNDLMGDPDKREHVLQVLEAVELEEHHRSRAATE